MSRHGAAAAAKLLAVLAALLSCCSAVVRARVHYVSGHHPLDRNAGPLQTCDTSKWRDGSVVVVQLRPESLQIAEAHTLYHVAPAYNSLYYSRQKAIKYINVVPKDNAYAKLGSGHHRKPFVLRTVMRAHPDATYIIWQDNDLVVSRSNQELVCLLERWGFKPHPSDSDPVLMIPSDPDMEPNYQGNKLGVKQLNWNTGFQVWRNSEKSRTAVELWCSETFRDTRWREQLYWDQSVFNINVRPTLQPTDVIVLDCNEANGHIILTGDSAQCEGKFIFHAWWNKEGAAEVMKQRFFEMLYVDYVDRIPVTWLTEEER